MQKYAGDNVIVVPEITAALIRNEAPLASARNNKCGC
jgi:hypothetical protein